jgi:hypothetical protein
MKIRVFKTPSKTNPDRVHIGIPDALKLDTAITEIQLTQTEVLSAPSSIADLARNPIVLPNKSINAFQNVGVSNLMAGYKMVGTIKGAVSSLQPPLEIEEVVIPEGFDHLDDVSTWHVYNYNSAFKLSDSDFGVLPGDKNLPVDINYELIVKGNRFLVKHDQPIDEIAIYYKRVYKNSELEAFWIPLATLSKTSDEFEFPLFGEYDIRIVPMHSLKQLASFKEYRVSYKEEEKFNWSAIQIDLNRYQIRLEGILGSTITELDIFENGTRLSREKLRVDNKGRVEKTFIISGVSDSKKPLLTLKYYRVAGAFRSLVNTETRSLFPTKAIEPISLKVDRLSDNSFELFINDPFGLLYSAINTISPFEGAGWQKAIQNQKYMTFISIKRHQDGLATDYGYYPVNVTSGNDPKFLSNPPFTQKVTKVNNGFAFVFEDTKKFREIKNLDDPNLEKKIAYEFRLLYWTAGIQQCLDSGSDYIFTKETPILVKNKRRAYKYSYSVWKEEHPVRKYEKRIPVDVEYAYLGHHLMSSKSPAGYVLSASPSKAIETSNIILESQGWRVLYFYNDKDDEIQTFPYSSFSISIPPSSQLTIDIIRIYIESSNGKNVLLGEHHPGDNIEVVDFLGYYEARKFITKEIDVQSEVSEAINKVNTGLEYSPVIASSSKKTSKMIHSTPSRMVNTERKRNSANKNNSTINKKITEVIETGILSYRIDVIYKDGKTSTLKFTQEIEDIPKLPPEPEDNQSVATGNKTVSSTLQVTQAAVVSKITANIQTTSLRKFSKVGSR